MVKRDEVPITQTVVFALIPLLAGSPFRVFNPPGYPFLPKPPLRVFDLPGVQILFIFIPNFCPNLFFLFFGSPGCPFLPGLFCSFRPAGLFYTKYFLTASAFTGDGKSSPSMVVNNKAPPEKTFLTTNGPS